MELIVALVALIVGGIGLSLALNLRGELARTREALAAATTQATSQAAETQRSLAGLREQLDRARAELAGLREATEPPPLTLPKARSSGLDDLREQLRAAAQREPDETDEA